ncbi:hypothetical protein N0O92_02280 [Alkalihalobacillus sp. MEB130]|uniref:hypothetical protein n=1 Tax=Alkalihalobacillus sp. MEB130 TaxID=2976704 RepID=UPI0028DFB9DE|nr:hypothetical protein [Alkalihalobacillus sp. MEB130]MDT8859042.1 hypothetical protein [Alkalihalobacillus sp. MEB130]
MKKDKIVGPIATDLVKKFKEEYAHEFGIHHSVQESDAKFQMVQSLLSNNKKKNQKRNQTKQSTHKDHTTSK